MKKICCMMIALVLCAGMLAGCTPSEDIGLLNVESKSYSTPEDAVHAAVSAIADNDARKLFAASAVTEAGAGYDLAAQAKQLDALPGIYYAGAPSEYEMYQDMNELMVANTLATQVRGFCYSFFIEDDLSQMAALTGDAQLGEYIEKVNPANLKELKVLRVDLPYPNTANSDDIKAAEKQSAALYGADNQEQRIALLELDGTLYWAGFTLLQYGNDWKVLALYSPLANQPATGAVVEVMEEEYIFMTE